MPGFRVQAEDAVLTKWFTTGCSQCPACLTLQGTMHSGQPCENLICRAATHHDDDGGDDDEEGEKEGGEGEEEEQEEEQEEKQ